jgi:hypothetical protein
MHVFKKLELGRRGRYRFTQNELAILTEGDISASPPPLAYKNM